MPKKNGRPREFRKVRVGAWESWRLDEVSDLAELLWWRLLGVCDAEGRHPADGPSLAASAGGRRAFTRGWVPEKLRGVLEELVAVDLIEVYAADGREYLQMRRWDNDTGANPAFPGPSEGVSVGFPRNLEKPGEVSNNRREKKRREERREEEKAEAPPPPAVTGRLARLFEIDRMEEVYQPFALQVSGGGPATPQNGPASVWILVGEAWQRLGRGKLSRFTARAAKTAKALAENSGGDPAEVLRRLANMLSHRDPFHHGKDIHWLANHWDEYGVSSTEAKEKAAELSTWLQETRTASLWGN